MTIYELERKATPGKLHVESGDANDHSPDGYRLMTADGIGQVAHSYGLHEDMLLLAHCRNNFISALEALKRATRSMSCQCCHIDICGHEHDCETQIILNVIDKLEEVK